MMVLCLVLLLLLGVCPAQAAIDTDGVDDAANGAALSTYFTASTKTVMAWFTPAATGGAGTTCQNSSNHNVVGGATATIRFNIGIRSATEICGGHFDGASATVFFPPSSMIGHTMHVALVHSGGTLAIYYNGVLRDSVPSGNTDALTQLLAVGKPAGGGLQGRIHHVATYNVAVPPAEIAVLGASRMPRLRRTLPTGEWLFDNCAVGANGVGVNFRDHSFNARTLAGVDPNTSNTLLCRGTPFLLRPGGIQ